MQEGVGQMAGPFFSSAYFWIVSTLAAAVNVPN